jgi:hypothetical protein
MTVNPLSLLLRLPLLPVEGVIWLGEVIRDEAERELHDPGTVRRDLEEADLAAQAGRLSPAELARVQEGVVRRIVPDRR